MEGKVLIQMKTDLYLPVPQIFLMAYKQLKLIPLGLLFQVVWEQQPFSSARRWRMLPYLALHQPPSTTSSERVELLTQLITGQWIMWRRSEKYLQKVKSMSLGKAGCSLLLSPVLCVFSQEMEGTSD